MEFEALVLCDEDHELSILTGAPQASKALLSIANVPMICYTMDWCEKAGFSNITIVAKSDHASVIKETLASRNSATPVHVISCESKYTGEAISSLKGRISRDFVIVPCDVITDLDPELVIDSFRKSRSPDTLMTAFFTTNKVQGVEKQLATSEYLIHTPLSDSTPAIFLDSYNVNAVAAQKALKVRTQMLRRYPNAVVSTNKLSSGIYICQHGLLELLSSQRSSSRPGSRSSSVEKISRVPSQSSLNSTSSTNNSHILHPVAVEGKSWSKVVRDLARRSWQHSKPFQTVNFVIIPEKNCTLIRANNMFAFLESNRWILKQSVRTMGLKQQQQQQQHDSSARIGADSIVAETSTVGDKSSIKRSVIGSDCKIGKNCKIAGCVILNQVVIDDNSSLDGCIVGSQVHVRGQVKLTRCNIEPKNEISLGLQATDESLVLMSTGLSASELHSLSTSEESSVDSNESEFSEEENADDYYDDDGLFER